MAGLNGQFVVEDVLCTTGPLTLIQIVAPANQRLLIKGISIAFAGVTPTDPSVLVRIVKQTTAGTASALTPVKRDASYPETLQATGQKTFTVEPTSTDIIFTFRVQPQYGYREWLPFDEPIPIPGGTRMGIKVDEAGTSVKTNVTVDYSE